MPVSLNKLTASHLTDYSFILTSGHKDIWHYISDELRVPYFFGDQMSAERKLFITKLLQENGKHVIAYGDGMNDYYMLKQADEGFLVAKPNGDISRSLVGKDIGGLTIV